MDVTPHGGADTVFVGITNNTIQFTVSNIGQAYDSYLLSVSCPGLTCSASAYSTGRLQGGAGMGITVTFSGGTANMATTVSLSAMDSVGCYGIQSPALAPPGPRGANEEPSLPNATCYTSSGYYSVVIVAGPAPIVSLAPYSPGYSLANDGVIYSHTAPALGSMGTTSSIGVTYNSTAVCPTALVALDVTNGSGLSRYPTMYQVQVQLVSNSTYLTLLNGSTSVYYTAISGTTQKSRLLAAIDAKANGLATGAYPVNLVVTSVFSEGPRTTTVTSRLLVNDQTGSSFGAGVGLTGIPRLFSTAGSYGLLLVTGEGLMSYFDRSCSSCAFVSSAGESGKLMTYAGTDTVYRLTALDGSITDFRLDGRVKRHYALAGVQDLWFTWTDTLLTSVTDASSRGFSLIYASGKLTQISDFTGRVTAVTISTGQLIRVIDPDGLKDSLIYGANSLLSRIIDRAGSPWGFAYNPLNQQSSDTSPAAVDYTGSSVRPAQTITTPAVVAWQPALAGTSSAPKANIKPDTLMGMVIDALGNITRGAKDRFGLLVKVVNPLGETTTIARDTLGNDTLEVEPNGHSLSRTYAGYLLSVQRDNTTGEFVAYTYDTNNRLQKSTGGNVRVDYFYHDGTQGPAGTLKEEYLGNTNPPGYPPNGGVVASWHYPDMYGRDTLVVDGGGHRSRQVYAAAGSGGNLLQVVDPKGHVTTFHYNSFGFADTTTLISGAKVVKRYDILNRDSVMVDGNDYATQYFYSPLGLTRIVDPKGQVYKIDLNTWGLAVARHDLGDTTKVDSLGYDAAGNIRTVKTRRGDVITMTYDALHRMLTRSGPDFPAESFAYGLNGAWIVAVNVNGRDSIAFDQAGRPVFTSQRMPDGTTTYQMTYGYDSHGRLINRSAPTGGSPESWVYNGNLGTLDTICGVGTCAAVARDTEAKPDTITYNPGPSGSWTQALTWDSLHQVTRRVLSPAQAQADLGDVWHYDSLGALTWVGPVGLGFRNHQYRYDQAGQLTRACVNDPITGICTNEYGQIGEAYTYDPAGNRTDPAAGPAIGPGNRVTQFRHYAVYYDPNGNTSLKAGLGSGVTDTTSLQWNATGQLTRVEKWPAGGAHTVTTFAYDAIGRRVGRTINGVTTWMVYDGDQVAMDVDAGSGSVSDEYSYAGNSELLAMKTPSWTGVAVSEPSISTVRGMVAAQGGAEIKNFGVPVSPWGQVSSDTGSIVRFRMGGQEYDQETGLYHLGARYYDPQMGRFLSEDPSGIDGGLNLYEYAANDPVDLKDPNGLDFCYTTWDWMYITTYPDGSSDTSYTYITICVVMAGGDAPGGLGDGPGLGGDAGGSNTGNNTPWQGQTPLHQIHYQAVAHCPALNTQFVRGMNRELAQATTQHAERGGYYTFHNGTPSIVMNGTNRQQASIVVPPHPGASGFYHTHQNTTGYYQGPDNADSSVTVNTLSGPMVIPSQDSLFIIQPTGTAVGCARPTP